MWQITDCQIHLQASFDDIDVKDADDDDDNDAEDINDDSNKEVTERGRGWIVDGDNDDDDAGTGSWRRWIVHSEEAYNDGDGGVA